MRSIKERLNKKGFTLAELLIVVAIIAVLVAVSVPVFNSKLEKSREATDIANMRAAKAAAVSAYLSEDDLLMTDGDYKDKAELYYDAANGILVSAKGSMKAYGQGTKADGNVIYEGYTNKESYINKIIKVTIEDDGTTAITWE